MHFEHSKKYNYLKSVGGNKRSLVIIIFTIFGVCSTSFASDNNLLQNPSFNIGDHTPENWKFRSWNQTDQNAAWDIESSGKTGQCVTIRSKSAKGVDAAWTSRVTVEPNTFYRLSGWIKTRNVQGATGALLNIQNMAHVRTEAVRGTRDWTEVSTVFRTGPSPREVEINCLLGGWGQSTGQAWYDDISISPTALSDEARAIVTINADATARPYSPMIFGGFIEHFHRQIYGGIYDPGSHLSDEKGFRKDVIEAMKELNMPVVRWPGGCFVSGYHWKDGVGQDRKSIPDPVWGDIDSNAFGTDEFVEWCRRIGTAPYICTNAGNGTPEEMAEWVQYCNADTGKYAQLRKANGYDKPFNVRYWSIGNENYGSWEIGASTPAKWGPLVRRSAELMLQVDPDITLFAAATSDRNWTRPLLEAAGDALRYVSIHEYWVGGAGANPKPDYLTCIMESEGPERTIKRTIDILEETGYRGRMKIAFDEWNLRGWYHPEFPRKVVGDPDDPQVKRLIAARDQNLIPSYYTMADALFSASFYNACLRHADDVGMTNFSPIVNTRGPLYVHPDGIVKRTTFHVLSMYANLLKKNVVDVTTTSGMLVSGDRFVSVVDAIATADDTQQGFALVLVNRHPSESVDCTIQLNSRTLDGLYDAVVLCGDSPEAYNDIQHPDRVVPQTKKLTISNNVIKLPSHSLTILNVF